MVTAAMSKAIPMTGNPAKKRNYDDHEDDANPDPQLPPKTPTVSPTNASQGLGMASIQRLGNDRMDLETQMEGKLKETPKTQPPDAAISDSQNKRARLLPNNATLTAPTNPASPSSQAAAAKDSELTCRGSEPSPMGVPPSGSTGWSSELRRLDGNEASEAHSLPSVSSSGATSGSSDPHPPPEGNEAFNPAENMEVD